MILRLIIHLEPVREREYENDQRLQGVQRTRSLLGVEIPEVTLPVAPGHNLAVLVECTVQSYIQRSKGYDAARDLADRQQQFMLRGDA